MHEKRRKSNCSSGIESVCICTWESEVSLSFLVLCLLPVNYVETLTLPVAFPFLSLFDRAVTPPMWLDFVPGSVPLSPWYVV